MATGTEHIPAFIEALRPLIGRYGYLAVGGLVLLEDFGVPVPGETTLTAAAFFAGLGQLNIFLVAAIGFIGAVIGDNIGFAIGHYGGHPLVERFGKYVFLTPKRLESTQEFFGRRGGRVVVVARFIEGLRQLNGIIAGLSSMPWKKFAVFNAIGAVLWVGCWTAIGYFGGSHIAAFVRYETYVAIAAAAGLALYIAYRIIKHRRQARQTKH